MPCGNEMLVTIQISLYSSFRRAIETYLRFVSSIVGKQSSNYSCCTLPKVKNLCLNSEQFGCIPFTSTEKKRSKFIMMPEAHLCLRMPYVFAKSEVNLFFHFHFIYLFASNSLSQRSASMANTLYNLKMVTLKCYLILTKHRRPIQNSIISSKNIPNTFRTLKVPCTIEKGNKFLRFSSQIAIIPSLLHHG